jgi:hypothetical protein
MRLQAAFPDEPQPERKLGRIRDEKSPRKPIPGSMRVVAPTTGWGANGTPMLKRM